MAGPGFGSDLWLVFKDKLGIYADFLEPVSKNRCEIKLVADYSFYKRIGNGNYANAARYLVNMIERVNALFGRVNWGINPNGRQFINLGVTIKEMKIHDRPTNAPGHYNAEISGHPSNHFDSDKVLQVRFTFEQYR
jgi:hypothetical protein